MARIERTIDIAVPVSEAYDQWTQFEDFPRFMKGIEEVHQVDDRHLHWRARIGGKEEEWDAEIREQVPDQRIVWRNTSGAVNAGMVSFSDAGPGHTRVHLDLSYDPTGVIESLGDMLGFVSRRVEDDLKRYKQFLETRTSPTGAWRGELPNPHVPGGHTRSHHAMAGGVAHEHDDG